MSDIRWLFNNGLMVRERSRETPTKMGRWRASDAGKCEIAQLLDAYGVKPDVVDRELLFKFQMCSNIEDFVVDTLVLSLEEDEKVSVLSGPSNSFSDNKLNVSGHADIIIRNMHTGEIIDLIEVKALNCFFFRKFEKEPIENAYFYGQLQMYASMAGLDEVTLVVVERNTPKIHYYTVPFDEQYYRWLVSVYDRLNAYYEAKIFPPVREVQGEMACKFCKYYNVCLGGEKKLSYEALVTHEEAE